MVCELPGGTARAAGIQELDETDTFQQFSSKKTTLTVVWVCFVFLFCLRFFGVFCFCFCGTPLLTSVSQQHFYNYYCSVWKVIVPGFRYSWYVLISGGCHICIYDLSNWIISSLEAAFSNLKKKKKKAELCMREFLSSRNLACWNSIFRLAECSEGWLVKKEEWLSTLADQQQCLNFHFAKQSCIDSILMY